MRVGIIAPPWIPVPPIGYGGTEFVIDQLVRGLVRHGVDVALVAHPLSRSAGELRSIPMSTAGVDIGHGAHELHWSLAAYEELADADIVHDHTLTGAALGRGLWDGPLVFTNHGPFDTLTSPIYRRASQDATVVSISSSHAASTDIPTTVIPNGVDVADFPVGAGDGGYLLFLGRMAPEKGAHVAVEVARRTGRRLVIAAKAREAAERRYFDDVIAPLLGPDVEFVPEPATALKLELLAGASALLNPITWPEPFGLVMIEAMACGTPVLAFAHGAAPELVVEGVSGFLCASPADMCARVPMAEALDRAAVRSAVARRCSVDALVLRHLALYERLADASRARYSAAPA